MKQEKAIAKELIFFSLPLILSGVLQQLYSWADAYILGHSGAEGELMLGAVGGTATMTVFLINSMVGLTLGLSIMAAQEFGKKNTERIRQIIRTFFPIIPIFYAVLAAAAIFFLKPILSVMDMPSELFEYAFQYLRIVLISIPVIAVYNLFSALLRAVGNTKVSFYAVLISSVLNIILDILLVLVFRFGVPGAAAATVAAQIAMTVFIAVYAFFKYPQFFRSIKKCGSPVFREGLSFGLPPMLQNSITSVGNLVLQNFMNSFGAATVLAITTAYRVDSMMLLPIFNLGAAISSLVAQSKGSCDYGRIINYLKTGLTLMLTISVVLALLMFFCGAGFVSFFGVTGEALEIGRVFFKDLAVFYVLFGAATVLRSVLEGIGDITWASVIGIAGLAVRIVFSYIFEPFISNRAIVYAEAVSWIFLVLLMGARFLYKKRTLKAEIENSAD